MKINARYLELMRLVIETGSMTEAAERLRISQPAVSKAVQQLEAQLGFSLFRRERGRLTPTADATALLPEIIRASTALEAVDRLAGDLQGLKTGQVTVAATPVLGDSLTAGTIARFQATHPGVRVVLQTMPNHEVVMAVADHRVDLGLGLAPTAYGHVRAEDLCSSDLICVMPPTHPLCRLDRVGAADLVPFPLISFGRYQPIGALIEAAFQAGLIRLTMSVEVTQSATALALVRAGAGIAVIDGFTAPAAALAGLAARPVHPRVLVTARLLLPLNRPPSRHAEAFIGTLKMILNEKIDAGSVQRISRTD